MDRPGHGLRPFFSESVWQLFYNTQPEVILAKKIWNRCTGTKVPKWQSGYFLPNCRFCTFVPVHRFKIFFCQNGSSWVLWKSYYALLLKKYLRPCPGLSMYLSERINWIISSFPRWISKILFVLGCWDHFGNLGCRIGEGPLCFNFVSRQCGQCMFIFSK